MSERPEMRWHGPRAQREAKAERNDRIVADRRAGMKYREIGEKYNLSSVRVQQLVRRGLLYERCEEDV